MKQSDLDSMSIDELLMLHERSLRRLTSLASARITSAASADLQALLSHDLCGKRSQ